MSDRYLIIHGHFYQPPRENPWIMAVEPQDSAAPYADWNRRINRECYAPNGLSRLLNEESGLINKLINNYERLSFNFGPTLLSWLEEADHESYSEIIEADRRAADRMNGHGPALAQVYNHIIMPLANRRDRLTQIRWGLADFEARFGRKPEGMWLAETAADLETLRLLAAEGLKFTVLAQSQAVAVRPLTRRGEAPWKDVSGGRIDPREPYRATWGNGPKDYLDVFFYDGPISRAVAFEKLLSDGRSFLNRIEQAFGRPNCDDSPRLVNLATDGESYGHHFKFGDMALAWLFNHLEERSGRSGAIKLTNYGQYLALFPPTKEVRILDQTSWSCAHGVERWRSDCGCNTGGGDGTWNQKWRFPLRRGLNSLRDELALVFEQELGEIIKDPWAARDDYISVILSGYDQAVQRRFMERQALRPLNDDETSKTFRLLESQLMSLYMFTSCAWFFDEISGLEPVQNLRYALRAIELAQPLDRDDLARPLLDQLETIKPNDPDYKNGLEVWQRKVTPDSLNGRTLAAHWAAATVLGAPEILDFFKFPRFVGRRTALISGNGVGILAGEVELADPRLAQRPRYLCLAIYSGGIHLAVLTAESNPDEPDGPDWLDQGKLTEALGEIPSTQSALILWETMREMMPEASRFVPDDLLPVCRTAILSALVRDIYDDIKRYASDRFHHNQHLMLMHLASNRPITWMERFLFRVVDENELNRILKPAEDNHPINLGALNNLLAKRGLKGPAKEEPIATERSGLFFRRIFSALAVAEDPERNLGELLTLVTFIQRMRQEDFDFDLWDSQNSWNRLKQDRNFMARLSPEAEKAMADLGLALGFAK